MKVFIVESENRAPGNGGDIGIGSRGCSGVFAAAKAAVINLCFRPDDGCTAQGYFQLVFVVATSSNARPASCPLSPCYSLYLYPPVYFAPEATLLLSVWVFSC